MCSHERIHEIAVMCIHECIHEIAVMCIHEIAVMCIAVCSYIAVMCIQWSLPIGLFEPTDEDYMAAVYILQSIGEPR